MSTFSKGFSAASHELVENLKQQNSPSNADLQHINSDLLEQNTRLSQQLSEMEVVSLYWKDRYQRSDAERKLRQPATELGMEVAKALTPVTLLLAGIWARREGDVENES